MRSYHNQAGSGDCVIGGVEIECRLAPSNLTVWQAASEGEWVDSDGAGNQISHRQPVRVLFWYTISTTPHVHLYTLARQTQSTSHSCTPVCSVALHFVNIQWIASQL